MMIAASLKIIMLLGSRADSEFHVASFYAICSRFHACTVLSITPKLLSKQSINHALWQYLTTPLDHHSQTTT